MTSRRFSFVDALRGLASLGVVFHHAVEGHHIDQLPEAVRAAAKVGNFGVPVFFVISGFVIAHSLSGEPMTLTKMGRFIAKRSIRLDPPYWCAIVLAISFSILASRLVPDRAINQYSTPQIIAHLAYAQDILGYPNINSVFWTLCLEVQFYIVYAALLLSRWRWTIVVALAASLLWCFRIGPDLPGWFPELWYAFLLGAICSLAWQSRTMVPVAAAYFLLVVIAAMKFRDVFAMVTCATAATIFVVASTGRISDALNWRLLQFLGTISYSLYLIHNPITGAVFRIGKWMGADGVAGQTTTWIISTMACIAVAYAFWLIVERPSMMLSRTLFSSREPPVGKQSALAN